MSIDILHTEHALLLRLRLDTVPATTKLLALLARPYPGDVRYALTNEGLVLLGTLPADEDPDGPRVARLRDLVTQVANGSDPTPVAASPDDAMATLGWLVTARGWSAQPDGNDGLRITLPDEPDLPPLTVTPTATGIVVARALGLLPLRSPELVVRAAVAHAVGRINAALRFARVRVHDAASLVAVAESVLDPDTDEGSVVHALEGVRHGARFATETLEAVRHPAVATEYAIAHDLPGHAREEMMEV